MATPCKPLLPVLFVFACSESKVGPRIEPTFIEVTLDGETGSAEAPLAFSGEPATWTLTAQALDKNREPYALTGDLTAHVRPGRLVGDPKIAIENGLWTGTLTIEAAFGPTRLWLADEGDKDVDTARAPSFATGVSKAIFYALPTIGEAQRFEDPESNQIDGEWGDFRIADRRVVITEVGTDGFWATDLDDGPAGHGSLFVYTFGKPQGIVAGSQLASLSGGVQEYLATTQLSFPTYTAVPDVTLPIPEAAPLDPAALCSDGEVDSTLAEAYESSRVVLSTVTIPESMAEGGDDYADYVEFGQWPVTASNGCTFYVDITGANLDYTPPDHIGETLPQVSGVLVQVWNKWIIQVRDSADLVTASGAARSSSGASALRGRLPPRHRPTPR
jgi:hypothetical protein